MHTSAPAIWRLTETPPIGAPHLSLEGKVRLVGVDLCSILVQDGSRQDAYLALAGRPGSAPGYLASPDELIDRLLRDALAGRGDRLAWSPAELPPQRYHRRFWATPAHPHALPLSSDLLHGWAQARLTVRWVLGNPLVPHQVGAIIALGDAAPLVRSSATETLVALSLAARGWSWRLAPDVLAHWMDNQDLMIAGIRVADWAHAPWIALPHANALEVMS